LIYLESSPAIQKYPDKIGAAEEITFDSKIDTEEIDSKGFKVINHSSLLLA
jgi:hypothetical protein